MKRTKCKYCGAPIFFARHRAGGAAVPIDAEPDEDQGTITVEYGIASFHPAGFGQFTNHLATCAWIEVARQARHMRRRPPRRAPDEQLALRFPEPRCASKR